MRRWALLLLTLGALAPDPAGGLGEPAVARPRFVVQGREAGAGTAFFLPAPGDVGVVAVAAAHSFDLAELASVGELEFRLGRSGRRVARSHGFHAAPGRPVSAPGATLRDDVVIFALEGRPDGVRVLEAESRRRPRSGARVRILGVPATTSRDEDDIFGSVAEVSSERIEVVLDVPADLRGWGGAPALDHETGRVVGILQATWPKDGRQRLGLTPIEAALEAIANPLEGGRAAPFARFGKTSTSVVTRRPQSPERPEEEPAAISRARRKPKEGDTLLGTAGAVEAEVEIEIEHPHDGAVVGDPLGAFVSGRAVAHLGSFQRFDVVLVLDTSGSAAQMSGADINGNGIVGEGGFRGIFGRADSGDSILAAEVAAARELLRGLDPRSTRVGLVTFAGEPPRGGGLFSRGRAPAVTEEPLTSDYERIERALDRVLERGPDGMTHMAAGVDQATIELLGLRGGLSKPDPESEKVVLFLTDGQPTLPYDAIFESDNVKAVLRAADRSARADVSIHSFAIGPEALEGPIATVEMAERTGGYFTPVRHPADIVTVIENVSFANIEELEVRNLGNGAAATELVVHPDGSWGALVPVEPGRNRIEVRARTVAGQEARSEIEIQYAPGAPEPRIPERLLARRNRLLERRLLELKRDRLAAEQQAVEKTRRELVLEIEQERAEAQERAARQRKELDLEAERPEGE